jgi:predicted metal-dependent HD superfamily phosphohydrolase
MKVRPVIPLTLMGQWRTHFASRTAAYAGAVRAEYAHLTDHAFWAGRSKVLQALRTELDALTPR